MAPFYLVASQILLAARVDILRDDVVVGLAGRVNTGKSATLAALCRARGVDRADVVVSAEPGHHVEIVKKKLVDNLGGKLEGCPWIMLGTVNSCSP
jgi:GTP-binding protein EngB required for normal cell division